MAEALDPALPPVLDNLTRRVLDEAAMRGLMLVTAESCTGGLLASLLTDMPGRSHVFDRGFVTYTDRSKHDLLGVPLALIEAQSAVCEPVARAMAAGALARSEGDVAVAVTGYADKGKGSPREAGLVHFASARKGRQVRHRVEHFGDIGRAAVRLASLKVALEMLLERMDTRR